MIHVIEKKILPPSEERGAEKELLDKATKLQKLLA